MDGFLCPNTTLFSQELLTCDYWNKVNCDETERFYSVNEKLFVVPVRVNSGRNYNSRDSYPSGHGSFNNRSDRRQNIGTGERYGKSNPQSNRRTDYVVDDFQTIDRRGERRQFLNSGITGAKGGSRIDQRNLEYSATSNSEVHEENPEVEELPNADEYDEEDAATAASNKLTGDDGKSEASDSTPGDKNE